MTWPQKLLLGFLILVLGVGIIFYQTRYRDRVEGHLCIPWYKSARTLADTLIVDSRLPPLERGRGEYTAPIPTCGELRHLGRVQ